MRQIIIFSRSIHHEEKNKYKAFYFLLEDHRLEITGAIRTCVCRPDTALQSICSATVVLLPPPQLTSNSFLILLWKLQSTIFSPYSLDETVGMAPPPKMCTCHSSDQPSGHKDWFKNGHVTQLDPTAIKPGTFAKIIAM